MDHNQWLEQHDRMIADHEMRHDRDMTELRQSYANLQASQAKTENTLRRAIRLSVLDAQTAQAERGVRSEDDATRQRTDRFFGARREREALIRGPLSPLAAPKFVSHYANHSGQK